MKLVQLRKENGISLGIQIDDKTIDVVSEAKKRSIDAPSTMLEAVRGGERALKVLEGLCSGATCFSTDSLGPAITGSDKILCIGLNYRQHAAECHLPLPPAPVLFCKFSNAIAADGDEVLLKSDYIQYDYESELVVIIGKKAVDVSAAEALDHVFGYTCGNDLSTRDLQFARGGQWLISKTFDNFAPIGPCVVTADCLDPQNCGIFSKVNGELRQHSNTSDMIFTVAEIISDLSRHFPLLPGDIIFSGTPQGVMQGYPKEKQVWLKKGDRVEVGIEGIGVLRNSFI